MSGGGFVAVLVIDLHFPDAGSLKAKRKELSSIKAQLQTRMHVAVSETAHQDLWQRATLTAALTGGTPAPARDRTPTRSSGGCWRGVPMVPACSGSSPRWRICADELVVAPRGRR